MKSCTCATDPCSLVIDIEWLSQLPLTAQKKHSHYWWLQLRRCKVCGQNWLAGTEENVNESLILQKTTQQRADAIIERDEWETKLEKYEELILLSQSHHRSRLIFFNEAYDVIKRLIEQRPEITDLEILNLLNADVAQLADLQQMRTNLPDG